MSDKPIVTPTASILRDDKAILVFAGMIVELLVNAVPSLDRYSALLSLVVFLGFGLLVLHQSVEDLIYAWADAKSTVTVTTSSIAGTAGASESRTVETVKPISDEPPTAILNQKPLPLPPDAGSVG